MPACIWPAHDLEPAFLHQAIKRNHAGKGMAVTAVVAAGTALAMDVGARAVLRKKDKCGAYQPVVMIRLTCTAFCGQTAAPQQGLG